MFQNFKAYWKQVKEDDQDASPGGHVGCSNEGTTGRPRSRREETTSSDAEEEASASKKGTSSKSKRQTRKLSSADKPPIALSPGSATTKSTRAPVGRPRKAKNTEKSQAAASPSAKKQSPDCKDQTSDVGSRSLAKVHDRFHVYAC